MFEQEDVDNFNDKVDHWNKETRQAIVNEMQRLGIKHYKYSPNRTALAQAFKSTVIKKQAGVASRIKFTMPQSSIFLHKGVSRSHPKSNRRAVKEWFNPVIEQQIDKLSSIVADGSATLVINALKIK